MAFSMAWREAGVETWGGEDRALGLLRAFRGELYRCLTARADALFELADAVLCADGPVRVLAGLSLAPEHRRGHGAAEPGINGFDSIRRADDGPYFPVELQERHEFRPRVLPEPYDSRVALLPLAGEFGEPVQRL